MLTTFFLLIIVVILGCKITHFFLGNKIGKIEVLVISPIIGLTLMSYWVLIFSLLSKELKFGVYSFLVSGGVYSIFILFQYFRSKSWKLNLKKWEFNLFFKYFKKLINLEIIFLLLIILLYFNLFSKTLVFDQGSYKVAAAGYGDIPFHMTQVSYFIHHQPFELESPIYLGQKLSYPFLINLLSSSFYTLNQNYLFSFHLPAFILVSAGIVLLYLLISKFIKKKLIRISCFLIFFFGSGLGFLRIIKDSSIWAKNSIGELINYILHLPYPITVFYDATYPNQNIIWSDFLTMFLLHQRAFFYGFSLGVLCLFILCLSYLYKKEGLFCFGGILIGLLPLIHTHSFVALSLIAGSFLIASIIKKDWQLIRGYFQTLLVILIIALPQLFFLHSKINSGFLFFRLGWMTEPGTIGAVQYNPAWKIHLWEWLSFIWQNFSLFFPLLIIAILFLILRKNSQYRKEGPILPLIIGTIFILLIVNIIKFQPWDFDNNKILAYALLMGCVIIGCFFEQWKFKGKEFLVIILTFFIILSGVIDVLSRSSLASPTLYEIFSSKDQLAANWILKNIESKEVILTSSHHLNLVSSLAGKPVLLGYPGWLWTHGIEYQERERDLNNMYKGGEEAEKIFEKYQVNYVMISSKEKYEYLANEIFFNQKYPIVFQLDDIKIYKIK